MGETHETKQVIDKYAVIWCAEKDGVYTPLSLDSSYKPTPELKQSLEGIGFRLTRNYFHARVTIQNEVKEDEVRPAVDN